MKQGTHLVQERANGISSTSGTPKARHRYWLPCRESNEKEDGWKEKDGGGQVELGEASVRKIGPEEEEEEEGKLIQPQNGPRRAWGGHGEESMGRRAWGGEHGEEGHDDDDDEGKEDFDHLSLCTLHPTIYILHSTPLPYALHPTPYTLLPTPYPSPPTLYTLKDLALKDDAHAPEVVEVPPEARASDALVA